MLHHIKLFKINVMKIFIADINILKCEGEEEVTILVHFFSSCFKAELLISF